MHPMKSVRAIKIRGHVTWILLVFLTVTDGLAQVQIVNCDAPVQSRKRGIAVNSLSAADFRVMAPGVSWYYNWSASPLNKPNDVTMDFIPMAWNGDSSYQTAISSYLAAGNRPWRVFAINEPNLAGQAFMTPSNTAIAFKQVKAICDPYNIPVISPHMAEGSATGSSITAYDPIEMSNVTYTSEEPFLKAFYYYCGATTPAGSSTHSYSGFGDLTFWTGLMHSDFPTQTVWVTEFNNGATSDAAVLANLIPSVDYCERTPYIEGYSWFMSRISGDPHNSILSTNSGVLTAAGQAYVQMPVHSTNIFYRIPGRLQAERYVTMNNMNIAPTTDTDGLADMIAASAGGSCDYNLQVDSPGNYPLSFRVAGAVGSVKIYTNNVLLGSATVSQSGWTTVSTTVSLTAGTQTVHVVLGSTSQRLNWVDFLATNGTPSVPDNFSAVSATNQIALSWSPAAGATGYNLFYSTTSGGTYSLLTNLSATAYTNSSFPVGTNYYFVVAATNAAGASSNSVEVNGEILPPPVNLALHQPAFASSLENSGDPATNAVDGNTSTRWSSAFSDPQWIYVDLQTTNNITEVILNWENAYGKSYQIQVSTDAVNWTNIYSTTSGAGGIEDLTGISGVGRYVRMYGTARGTQFGYSLWEFEVFGTPFAPANPPTLVPVNASIINGQFQLSVNGGSGQTYSIQASTDLSSWTTVFTTNSPALPFIWTTSNLSNSIQFYRVLASP
jgi:Glycosyl hydrolase catalytic core/F5/8 type C domain/Carbohydrate binding module (family 6)